jgi:uncharacterized repeat protein (TIGR01451 family)
LRLLALPAAIALLPVAGQTAPGDTLFSDNFNDGTLAPWTTTNATRSGITSSPPLVASGSALYTRYDAVTVTSPSFNAAVPAARLSFWLRRGSDAFVGSEDTDAGEDFYVEYRRADNSWAVLATYLGSGTKGQIYTDQYTLPADARHGNLALRVRQIAGSGVGYDYWHFDDVLVREIAVPGPLAVGSCDDFEFGLGNWTINPTTGFAGISNATSSSPSNSLFLNGGVVAVTSNIVDTTSIWFSDVTMWIRRGSDAFSELPDLNENLVVEYLNNVGAWVTLETFAGNGGAGQIFLRSYTLPAAGRHAGLRLRYRMTGGSGVQYDFWHIDDVCFAQNLVPGLLVSKMAQTLTDPINGGSNPKAIPGAVVQYTVGVSNQGPGSPDPNSIIITDPLPAGTALFVDTSGGDPIVFVDGSVPSGLVYNYAGNVTFSSQPGGGAPYNHVPMPDAQGFDPLITGYRINPTGIMNPAIGGNVPSFNIRLRVRIE